MKKWTKMPSSWFRDSNQYPLKSLRWTGDNKAHNTVALMLYVVLVHHANTERTKDYQEVGLCGLSYSDLSQLTGVSRTMIAGGLKVLNNLGVISWARVGRSNLYKVRDYEDSGNWAKLPVKGLYSSDLKKIKAFHEMNLRSGHELNALKIYLIIVSFRNTAANHTNMSYDKIVEYTGVPRNKIRTALSLLVNLDLLHIDNANSEINEFSTSNIYRVCHIEPYRHRGSMERGSFSELNV